MADRPGRLDPAVADVRRAVRVALTDVEPGEIVLVACSGGADSMALAAATRFEATAAGWSVAAVVVDHGLQPGSAQVAADVAARLDVLGIGSVRVVRPDGEALAEAGGGPEAAARSARYAALGEASREMSARCVVLGHTRDDQAETVLLGLARGSGARSLSGMAPVSRIYRRPLLDLSGATTERACAAEGIEVWRDPHNEQTGFARVRVRRRALPVLEAELGPGVAEALARTARLLRDDADALDVFGEAALERCRTDSGLDVERLQALLPALRRRVLRQAALAAGCPSTDLTAGHVEAVESMVTHWRGQHGVDLPGALRARRHRGIVRFDRHAVGG